MKGHARYHGSPLESRDSLVPTIGLDGRASSQRRSSADELGLVSEGLGKKCAPDTNMSCADELGLVSEGLGKKDASDTKHKVPTGGPGQPVYHGRRVARSPQPSGWTAGPRHTGASSAAELGWCRKG